MNSATEELIEYYEIQRDLMSREIERLRGVINQKNRIIEELQNSENSKNLNNLESQEK